MTRFYVDIEGKQIIRGAAQTPDMADFICRCSMQYKKTGSCAGYNDETGIAYRYSSNWGENPNLVCYE